MAEEFTAIGKRIPLKDAFMRVTGRALFTGDRKLNGMLYCKILRNPHAHAKIKSLDTTKAEALPGVKAVVTYKDKDTFPMVARQKHHVLLPQEVYYVGQEVAAVAATSREIAEEALELIEVDYEVLPAVFEPEEAKKPGAPVVHAEAPDNVYEYQLVEVGDLEQGLAEADFIFEGRRTLHPTLPVPLETHPCLSSVEDGRLIHYKSDQAIHLSREWLAKGLGWPRGNVRVIGPYCGGGFGSKYFAYPEDVITAILAIKSGRPVLFNADIEDEFVGRCGWKPEGVFDMKVGIKEDGTITAVDIYGLVNPGCICGTPISCMGGFTGGWRWSNYRYEQDSIYTFTHPRGSMRLLQAPLGKFAINSFLDEIAGKMGIDYVDILRKNHKPDVIGGETQPTSQSFDKALQLGIETIGWENRTKPEEKTGVKRRGIGVALGSAGGPRGMMVSSAFVKVSMDGSAQVITGTVDCGAGSNTTLAQICAETLGVPYESVSVASGDTETGPFDYGSIASRVCATCGNAVFIAAEDAKAQLFEKAATMLEVTPEELEAKDGRIYVKENPDQGVTHEAVMLKTFAPGINVLGRGVYQASFVGLPAPTHHGLGFAEVEVDTETGQVDIIKYTLCIDVGRAINPECCEGQASGGSIMGIGYGLLEECIEDRIGGTGKCLNPRYESYRVPTFMDIGEIIPQITEFPGIVPATSWGQHGLGEPPIAPGAPAVSNAISNAIGVWIDSIPITPDKILKALGKV